MNEKSTMAINRDYADLDGRLLKLLLAVVETGSITGAALQLGVTQSAVSHLLDKLRARLHRLLAGCGLVGARRLGAAVEALRRTPGSGAALAHFDEAAGDLLG